jgi:hypothetical protein
LALTLAGMLALSLADAAIVIAVSESYLGRPVSVARALGHLTARSLPLIIALFLRGAASYIAMLALIVPGIYVYCRLAVLPAVIVLEDDVGAIEAIDRAWKLTEGRVGDTFLSIALVWIVYTAVGVVFTLGVQAVGAFVPFFAQPGVVMTSGRLAAVFVYPCVGVVTTLIYYDLRIRKEAFDMEVMTSALDARPD